MSNAVRIETTRSKVTVNMKNGQPRIFIGKNQKNGSKTVELRQEITTTSYYKSVKYSNNEQDSLFSDAEYGGASEKSYTNTEVRIDWINVPVDKTNDEILALVASLSNACIRRVLSNAPILTDDQKSAIASPKLEYTLDDAAESQVIRNPQTAELALDQNGKVQYRKCFFAKTFKQDIDLRGNGEEYMTEAMRVELEGAVGYDIYQDV